VYARRWRSATIKRAEIISYECFYFLSRRLKCVWIAQKIKTDCAHYETYTNWLSSEPAPNSNIDKERTTTKNLSSVFSFYELSPTDKHESTHVVRVNMFFSLVFATHSDDSATVFHSYLRSNARIHILYVCVCVCDVHTKIAIPFSVNVTLFDYDFRFFFFSLSFRFPSFFFNMSVYVLTLLNVFARDRIIYTLYKHACIIY